MIAPTWKEHCSRYLPGLYGSRSTSTPKGVARDADELEHILSRALWRLAHTVMPDHRELMSAGTCWGDAA